MSKVGSHLFKVFAGISQTYPSKKAVIFSRNDTYEALTYAQIFEQSVRLGNIFKNNDFNDDQRITIILENQPEYIISFFAVMYAGATVVPIDIQFSSQLIKSLMLVIDSKILITTERIGSKLRSILPDVQILMVDSQEFQEQMKQSSDIEDIHEEQLKNELAVLFFTSGTTELPKSVMLTHFNLLSNVRSIQGLNIVDKEDRFISILPLHHAYSFTVTFLLPLLSGATIVYPPTLTSVGLLTCMKETKTTVFVAVPQIFSLIYRSIHEKMKMMPFLKRGLIQSLENTSFGIRQATNINIGKKVFQEIHKTFGENLRFMISGGARLDPDIALAFKKWGFTMLEGYGLTETSPVVSFNTLKESKIGSVGKPISGVEIQIIDKDSKGVGEVIVRGPNVMAGYYNMKEKTAEVIRDGWFYTGDLGFFDKNGYLVLVGRKKEIIVLSSGKNINPEEVEKFYSQSSFIKEICVLSTKKGNSFLKGVEHLAAVIVIDDAYFQSENVSNIREKIKWEIDNFSIKLPTYKRIRGFVVAKDDLPRTRLGKLMRHKVELLYDELVGGEILSKRNVVSNGLEVEGKGSDSEYTQVILSFLSRALNQEVKMQDHLELDLELDSLGKVELLLGLQNSLNLDLTDEEAMDFFMSNTVEDILRRLKEYIPRLSKHTREEEMPLWDAILKEPLPEYLVNKIILSLGFFSVLFNVIWILLFRVVFKVFFFLRVEGVKNLKIEGPYLICPNHASYLDALLVLSALPLRVALNTYFVGYNQVFERFFLKNLVKIAKLIPIEVNYNLVEALKMCAYVIRSSKIVCYFPEGQRSVDGEIKDFKSGVGILIKEVKTPVVPVYIKGSFYAWPRFRKFPRFASISVCFGKTLMYDDIIRGISFNHEGEYKMISKRLRDEVLKLQEKE